MRPAVPEGVSVRVSHLRRAPGEVDLFSAREWKARGKVILPKGGMTLCMLSIAEEGIGKGIAFCSEHDNYNRRIGRDIALGRALKAAKEAPVLFDGN